MLTTPVPYEKIRALQDKLGLDAASLADLNQFKDVFIRKKDAFAEFFYATFQEMPETRMLLEHTERPGFLKKAWAHWFGTFFTLTLDDTFIAYLWRIGLRHVEVNLDQRFSNLGFSFVRQFCQEIIRSEIPPERVVPVTESINKMLDFCLLVETSAYIEATIRCDIEVIKGLADRIRNPVTIIGGNIRRLQKKIDADNPSYGLYEDLFEENRRLERMVKDVKKYFELFENEPQPEVVVLADVIATVLSTLRSEASIEHVRIDITIPSYASRVWGDRRAIEHLFYYLLQNSIEALDKDNPLIHITADADTISHQKNIIVEIFNTGSPPSGENIERLYSPFFSTKTSGTGFGLPIAQLAARKNYGHLIIKPVQDKGTKLIITLPMPE